jgi:hypothetical protein
MLERNHRVLSISITTKVLLLCFGLLLATPSQAFGYADPGTGAFVYQALYAAFIGGTFYFRKFLNRIWGRRK